MSSACRFIFMQIKVIFVRMVSHLDSLWNRGTRELENDLLWLIIILADKFNLFLWQEFELDVLEEAYTTEHWLVRIYKVKDLENRGSWSAPAKCFFNTSIALDPNAFISSAIVVRQFLSNKWIKETTRLNLSCLDAEDTCTLITGNQQIKPTVYLKTLEIQSNLH